MLCESADRQKIKATNFCDNKIKKVTILNCFLRNYTTQSSPVVATNKIFTQNRLLFQKLNRDGENKAIPLRLSATSVRKENNTHKRKQETQR